MEPAARSGHAAGGVFRPAGHGLGSRGRQAAPQRIDTLDASGASNVSGDSAPGCAFAWCVTVCLYVLLYVVCVLMRADVMHATVMCLA